MLHCAHLGGKAKEIDEAFRIMVIVQIAGGEGSDGLIVQGVGGSGSGLNDVALVEDVYKRQVFYSPLKRPFSVFKIGFCK